MDNKSRKPENRHMGYLKYIEWCEVIFNFLPSIPYFVRILIRWLHRIQLQHPTSCSVHMQQRLPALPPKDLSIRSVATPQQQNEQQLSRQNPERNHKFLSFNKAVGRKNKIFKIFSPGAHKRRRFHWPRVSSTSVDVACRVVGCSVTTGFWNGS